MTIKEKVVSYVKTNSKKTKPTNLTVLFKI